MIITRVRVIVPKLQETIKLYNVHDSIRKVLNEKYKDLNWQDKVNKMSEDEAFTTSEENLIDFLSKLSTEEVALIQSVMYLGRESRYDLEVVKEPEASLESLFNNARQTDKDDMISQITSKKHLSNFLWEGIKILGL